MLARVGAWTIHAVLFLRGIQRDLKRFLGLIDIDILAKSLKVFRDHLQANRALRNGRKVSHSFEVRAQLPVLRFALAEFEHLVMRSEKVENHSGSLHRPASWIFNLDTDFGSGPSRECGRDARREQQHESPELEHK